MNQTVGVVEMVVCPKCNGAGQIEDEASGEAVTCSNRVGDEGCQGAEKVPARLPWVRRWRDQDEDDAYLAEHDDQPEEPSSCHNCGEYHTDDRSLGQCLCWPCPDCGKLLRPGQACAAVAHAA